jgi:nucleoside-diphosphate-sugar epimerase
MKILVIGGTRFIGYHLVRRLLDDGHEVTLFNRGLSPDEFGTDIRRIRGDRADRAGFYAKLHPEKFDAVADMIAYEAADSRSAVETFAGRVGHFFHISSGAVYIVTRDYPCPLREEDYDRELFPRPAKNADWWLYGFHKRGCEQVLREAHLEHKFPVTVFRLPIVLGERDYTLRAYSYFLRLEDGKPLLLPDSGLNAFTQIYAGDIAKTIASSLIREGAIGQAYNLAQDEIVTLRGFVLAAARLLKCQPDLVDIPTGVLEKASLGTSFSPFSNRRPFILSTAKARRDLGFTATPFDVWLEKTVRWFKQDYRGGPPENYRNRAREIQIAARYRAAVAPLEE